jgi:hypothetical protein
MTAKEEQVALARSIQNAFYELAFLVKEDPDFYPERAELLSWSMCHGWKLLDADIEKGDPAGLEDALGKAAHALKRLREMLH